MPPDADRPSLISSVSNASEAAATDVAIAHEETPAIEPRAAGARLTPLAVASGLFMEFVDSSALSTALPTLSREFHSDPVHLKLALTSYLLALAVFAPASGWVADRFGPKRVFLSAMTVFLFGSALCGAAQTLSQLVAARLVQGAGGAMMTPVGRAILVGATPREQLVSAMVWFTTPALVGPLLGPPIAGFILSVADWRWIFYVNLPVGILGMAAVVAFVPQLDNSRPGSFDTLGFVLTGLGITTLVLFAETAGAGLMPLGMQAAVAVLAFASLALYVRHSLRLERPILNLRLLGLASYRSSLLGGTLVRLGLGATPFLMPLLLQVGLGWAPAKSGFVTISTALGAMTCKPVASPLLRRFGFRSVLLWTVAATAILTAIPATFDPRTPIWLMVLSLLAGGFVRSLQFTSSNTIAYAEVEQRMVSQASTLATVTQQIGMSFGVSFGALLLHLARGPHAAPLTPDRFVMPFIAVGAVTLLALPVYWRLSPQAGASMSGSRRAAPATNH